MNSKTDWLQELDKEWIELIIEAKNLGMELKSIKEFITGNKVSDLLIGK